MKIGICRIVMNPDQGKDVVLPEHREDRVGQVNPTDAQGRANGEGGGQV